METVREVIPFYKRPWDILPVLLFLLCIYIAAFYDSAQAFSPAGTGKEWGMSHEFAKTAIWPPKKYYDFLIEFCYKSDQLLCVNPVWFKVMTTIAVSYNLPYYFLALYAFLSGKEIIRTASLIWSIVMTIFLWTMIAEQKYGEYKSQDFDALFVPYVAFTIIPWFVFLRVLGPHPFTRAVTRPIKAKSD
jgi:hypothetical protein